MKWTQNLRARLGLDLLPKTLRRVVVGVIGGTIVLIGIALLVLPGPAFIVIPLGFLILGSEFAWARRLLRRAKGLIGRPPNAHDKVSKEER
ncbi:MAG TPA: PGPGW domain-containing protein [Chthoniobacterales bacterium]|nr:PGPGW domain-containing protein [Chthoniobacterales bacterium]